MAQSKLQDLVLKRLEDATLKDEWFAPVLAAELALEGETVHGIWGFGR